MLTDTQTHRQNDYCTLLPTLRGEGNKYIYIISTCTDTLSVHVYTLYTCTCTCTYTLSVHVQSRAGTKVGKQGSKVRMCFYQICSYLDWLGY